MLSGDHSAKIGKEDEEIVLRLSEEVKYLKNQHEQLAQKLTKAERHKFRKKMEFIDFFIGIYGRKITHLWIRRIGIKNWRMRSLRKEI